MSKGIIVVDVPKDCAGCRFSVYRECGIGFCKAAKEYIISEKPDWCPIKPIKRKPGDTKYQNEYEKGWNACIDELLKGVSENE